MLLTIVTIVHLFTCAFLIAIVLLQQGKGADMGATFGGGSNTIFGAGGADNLLTRVTTITAFVFMCTSVYLSSSMRPSIGGTGTLLQSSPIAQELPVTVDSAPLNTAPPVAPETGAPAAAPQAAPVPPAAPAEQPAAPPAAVPQ